MHMAERGITLRQGPHGGRLLRPARVYIGHGNQGETHTGYNTAVYSDDGGHHWFPSQPFPDVGSEERRNLTAWFSRDAGHTWPAKTVLHPGPAAYSSALLTVDRDTGQRLLHVVFEGGETDCYEGIRYSRMPVSADSLRNTFSQQLC